MSEAAEKHEDLSQDELFPLTIRECLGPRPGPAEFAAWLKGEPRRRRRAPWALFALVGAGAIGLGAAALQSERKAAPSKPTLAAAAKAPAKAPAGVVDAEAAAKAPAGAVDAEALIREAAALRSARAFGRAEELYLRAHEAEPRRLDALEGAAFSALMRGGFAVGFARYLTVAEADPERREAAYLAAFGLMFAREGESLTLSAEAADPRINTLLERAWAKDWSAPARYLWQLHNARVLGELAPFEKALARYRQVDHGVASPLLKLPSLARASTPDALRVLKKARRRQGGWASDSALSILALLERGLVSEARRHARAWVDAEPANPAALAGLARCLREQGEDLEARALYDKAYAMEPSSAALVGDLVAMALAAEDLSRARRLLERFNAEQAYQPYQDFAALTTAEAAAKESGLWAFLERADADDPLRLYVAVQLYPSFWVERMNGTELPAFLSERRTNVDRLAWEVFRRPAKLAPRMKLARTLDETGLPRRALIEYGSIYERALASKAPEVSRLRDEAATRAAWLNFRFGQFERASDWLDRACLGSSDLAKASKLLDRGEVEGGLLFLKQVRWRLSGGEPLAEAITRIQRAAAKLR